MNNQTECRSCKEPLIQGAKWCPHCQRPQSVIRAIMSPQALILTLLIVGGYWYVTTVSMATAMEGVGGKAIYDTHEKLEIAESSFSLSEQKCDTCIYVIGLVKNTTNTPWSNIHFQVSFMDGDGKVVDVINDEDNDFVLGPNSEGRFKISGKASVDIDKYKSHEVTITKANPDSTWY